ncbi:MAG: peptidoglycan D,D-transpeptidase FtsI family protein [Sedimentisphaeraceae bacterium JB056]
MKAQPKKTDKRIKLNFSRIDYWFRLCMVMLIFISAAVALTYRCFQLGDYKTTKDSQALQNLQRIKVKLEPQKGLIVDTEGRLLAANKQVSTLFVDPVFLMSEPNQLLLTEKFNQFKEIENTLDLPPYKIEDTIFNHPNDRYWPIKPELTKEQVGFVKSKNVKGLGVVESGSKRDYITGELFSHIIGFASSNKKFSEGLESIYYDELTGQSGYETYLGDRSRRPINLYGESKQPVHGVSLILTADAVIQLYAREALHKRCKEYEAESGMAIVMNPENGAILAMTNYPDFDPTALADSEIPARRNRAVTDVYEPGSIMKPIVCAIALDMGVINKNTVIYCEKGQYCGKGFGCIGEYGNHSYGNLTVAGIIQHSSNIGMAKLGQKMGAKRLYNALRMFGFGDEVTHKKITDWTPEEQKNKEISEFLGEREGLLNRLERWNGYSITRVPYGQEIGVTALQIAKAYCILANGGRDVQPHIVRAFVDSNGANVITEPPSAGAGYIIKPEVADYIVKKAMVDVVNSSDGTGKKAALDDYTVFGKTGTANISVNKGYDSQNYVASFVGGAPAEDPRVIVLVSIVKPNRRLGKGYTGGTVSGPVVAEIIDKTLKYMKIPPENKD